ncbi:hypothetical protein GobsT_25480 [Gemmata obscuriglobus]|uniref:Uncharacterized protein n=1 Tax=Gemmata obscuriglobus TaxID=114 RepID=A0A2Z3H0C1_9BACT|nr:hypothetical protein C1280_20715 [Gemmata obscuriglobus]QEG27784.1 hypothetical protein GobsT_25480 [Gemmata obscuriglobus]VTS05094.1 Uncharacterized protein OS=Phycisphaera mikurensis (strain NBRC 102666 / KCTC 22515 / FYK2301M01) GN=PSMK_p00570 PE=4 SV=1 [Gemmata obscuriglobus UQM 2246]
MTGEHLSLEEKMTAFAQTFPSMTDAMGVAPWDAGAFDRWADETPISHGERITAQFLLAVWDSGNTWKCGRFDVVQALRLWGPSTEPHFSLGSLIHGGREQQKSDRGISKARWPGCAR